MIALHVATLRGSDQQSLAGLGNFMAEMLEQGTTNRSALQLSDDLEEIGAEHDTWTDWDSCNVSMKILSQHLDKGLDILSDVVLHPAFAKDEVERVRAQLLAAIQQERDAPHVVLRNTIARSLFPNHVYGESALGTAETVKRVDSAMLKAFYQRIFRPDQMVVVAVGDVTKETLVPKLEKALGAWTQTGPAPVALRAPAAVHPSIILIDRPGAAQSNISLAAIGAERKDKDFDAIQMANAIFGGMFSSRLNLNLREKHAYTYGARSGFQMRHAAGPLTASAAVDTPKTIAAIKEMLAELNRFRSAEQVTPEELSLARGSQVSSLPGMFESGTLTAGSIARLGVYDLPLDEYRTRAERFGKVTAADVSRVARQFFDPAKMKLVVVGDRKLIEADLAGLGFGPVQVQAMPGEPAGKHERKATGATDAPAKPAHPGNKPAVPAKPAKK
jgi:predicted Zn-dependent peptidase